MATEKQKYHEGEAAFHVRMAKAHAGAAADHEGAGDACGELASCMKSMAKGSSGGDGFEKAAEHFQKWSEHHTNLASHHAAMKDAHTTAASDNLAHAKKAEGANDLEKSSVAEIVSAAVEGTLAKLIRPDGISAVLPSDAPSFAFGRNANIRAVPRAGQPTPGAVDLSGVPPAFRHLVSSGDEV